MDMSEATQGLSMESERVSVRPITPYLSPPPSTQGVAFRLSRIQPQVLLAYTIDSDMLFLTAATCCPRQWADAAAGQFLAETEPLAFWNIELAGAVGERCVQVPAKREKQDYLCGQKYANRSHNMYNPLNSVVSILRVEACRVRDVRRIPQSAVLSQEEIRAVLGLRQNGKEVSPMRCEHRAADFSPKTVRGRFCSAKCRKAA
jgi:hypothetical protein